MITLTKEVISSSGGLPKLIAFLICCWWPSWFRERMVCVLVFCHRWRWVQLVGDQMKIQFHHQQYHVSFLVVWSLVEPHDDSTWSWCLEMMVKICCRDSSEGCQSLMRECLQIFFAVVVLLLPWCVVCRVFVCACVFSGRLWAQSDLFIPRLDFDWCCIFKSRNQF